MPIYVERFVLAASAAPWPGSDDITGSKRVNAGGIQDQTVSMSCLKLPSVLALLSIQ